MNAEEASSQAVVDAIVDARRSCTPARTVPPFAPNDRRVVYAAQSAVARVLGARVAGWKVGMLPDGTPMAAPMFASGVVASGATWKFPLAGTLIVEVEVALRLMRDLPPRPAKPYARDEVAAAVGEVLVGVELLESRFAGEGFPPFPVNLADNLANAGYVVGDAVRDFASLDLARLRCRYAIDGKTMHDTVGGHPQDDPWRPVLACLNEGLMGLGGFCAGQVITTGSLIKPMRANAAGHWTASLDGVGRVDVTLARPS